MEIQEVKKVVKVKTGQRQSTKMKMSKVGNQTNSQDPQAVNSRVFVGNLNTFQCSKTDVERMFQRYGRLAGISMHKGYAFVQFTNPFDARSACLGEDGRTILSQILDVNMVAEPKPHQTGRKRQNVAKTGNDWDYYYDSYYASSSFAVGPPRVAPPAKRPRLMSSGRNKSIKDTQKATAVPPLEQLKIYSNHDILICGNCREMFTELQELIEHKKTYCKLRFTCKCEATTDKSKMNGDDHSSASLLCVQCKDSFHNAWDLMVHAQAAHMLNIYELGIPSMGNMFGSPASHDDKENNKETSNIDQDEENEENGITGENGDGEHDSDIMENDNADSLESPHSGNDDKDEEIVDSNPPANCIRHALSIVSTSEAQPESSPPSLAATAPSTDEWKTQAHSLVATRFIDTTY